MAANDRVARLRLRFETTAQDLQRAKAAVGSLVREVDALEAKQRQLDAQYARSIQLQIENARALNQNSNFVSNLRSDLSALANTQENVNQATSTAVRSTNDAAEANTRLARSAREASQAQARVGSVSAGIAGRLGQVDRFGRVGGQILGGLGANEAANAVNLVGDVADSFTLLNPVMLGITGATAAFGLVLANAQRETERVAEATTARLNVEAELARFLATSNAEQQRERLNQARQQLRVEESVLEARQNELQAIDDMIAAGSSFDYVRSRLNLAFGEFNATSRAVDEQRVVVQGLRTEIEGLTGAIENADPVLAAILGTFERFEEIRNLIPDLSNKTKDLVLAQEEEARTAQEAAQALANANSEKTKEIQLAREAAAATAAELRAQGLTDITTELFEAQTAVVEASNAERIAQEALAAAQGKVTQNIREFEIAAEQERAENIRDAGEQRAKIAQDTEDRILDIQRKAGRSILDAIGNRDALAARNAAENAKEQISDERREAQKRLRELEDNLKKQNRMVDERLRERIRLEQQRGVEEINLKRQLLLQAQTDLRNANNAELLIRRQANIMFGQEAYLGGKSMVAFFKAGVDEALRAGMGGKGGSMGGKTQGSYFYTAPQFTGTLAPAPPSPFQFTTPQGGTPVTFAPTITGQTRQQVQKQLDARVNQVVEFMFTGRQMTA